MGYYVTGRDHRRRLHGRLRCPRAQREQPRRPDCQHGAVLSTQRTQELHDTVSGGLIC